LQELDVGLLPHESDAIIPIPGEGQLTVWRNKILGMEELTKKLARKYVLTFGNEYVRAGVQSSGCSGFRSQVSLGDNLLEHISQLDR
jgi:hypothetical protein